MLPQSPLPSEENSTKVSLLISFFFHSAIILALIFFAAREGLLGKQLKKITVEMVKETPPEKPKQPEKPAAEPPKAEPPKIAEAPKVETARAEPPKEIRQAPPAALVTAPPAVAPAAAELPSFEFGGGKAVQTSSDPVLLYNAAVELALRSKWRRPPNIADDNYVAEVEIAVDHDGRLSDPVWQKTSGDKLWDDSVRQAISAVQGLERPPPANFPSRVLVRFDVQDAVEPIGISQ
jgi:outer membrane biosynthesis protein TonB